MIKNFLPFQALGLGLILSVIFLMGSARANEGSLDSSMLAFKQAYIQLGSDLRDSDAMVGLDMYTKRSSLTNLLEQAEKCRKKSEFKEFSSKEKLKAHLWGNIEGAIDALVKLDHEPTRKQMDSLSESLESFVHQLGLRKVSVCSYGDNPAYSEGRKLDFYSVDGSLKFVTERLYLD